MTSDMSLSDQLRAGAAGGDSPTPSPAVATPAPSSGGSLSDVLRAGAAGKVPQVDTSASPTPSAAGQATVAAQPTNPNFFQRVGADLGSRANIIKNIDTDVVNNDKSTIGGGFDILGKGIVGGAGDVLGEAGKSAAHGIAAISSAITPELNDAIPKAATAVLNSSIGQAGVSAAKTSVDAYNKWKEQNPDWARHLEAAVDIAGAFVPVGGKTGAELAADTGANALKVGAVGAGTAAGAGVGNVVGGLPGAVVGGLAGATGTIKALAGKDATDLAAAKVGAALGKDAISPDDIVPGTSILEQGGKSTERLGQGASRMGGGTEVAQNFFEDQNTKAPLVAKEQVRSSISQNQDYQGALDAAIEKGRAATAPVYEKAFAGGSTAPLETQFQAYLSDSGAKVEAAKSELASAQNAMTQAAAKESRMGDNVYGANSALSDKKAAQTAIDTATENLDTANKNHADIKALLQKAQDDGSTKAPGAVWSPRLQQFMGDPDIQAGIKNGIKLQRQEALGLGEPFNPKEHAITGNDANGDPIVSSVPNMRALDAGKRGLDAQIEGERNELTGVMSPKGRALTILRNGYVNELKNLNPDYKTALDTAGDVLSQRNSFWEGKNIVTKNSDKQEIRRMMADKSPTDKKAALIGIAHEMDKRLGETGGNVSTSFSPKIMYRLSGALKPQDFSDLQDMVAARKNMRRLEQKMVGGSATTSNEEAVNELHGSGPNIGGEAMSFVQKGPVRYGIDKAINYVQDRLKIAPKDAEDIAHILYETDPDKQAVMIDRLKKQAALGDNKPLKNYLAVTKYLGLMAAAGGVKSIQDNAPASSVPPTTPAAPTKQSSIIPPNAVSHLQRVQNDFDGEFGNKSPLLDRIKQAESGGNNIANPKSSAIGPYQFIRGTWKDLVAKYGAQTGIGIADRTDPKAQETMAQLYARDNTAQLASALGRQPTDGEVYASWVFGPDGATKLLTANPDAKANMIMPDNVIRANRGIFMEGTRPRTVREVIEKLSSKVA